MSEWTVTLASPRLRDDELDALVGAYRSGWWTIGPQTEALEREVCSYTGAARAVAVSSCTAALQLACIGIGLGPGDTVVMPSINFAAAANVVAATGARPVFAEIVGAEEPWLDPASAQAELERGAKAVIGVAYGGHPGRTADLARAASEHDAVLLEDVAHAAGSRSEGRHLGTIGAAGTLSFSASKNLGIGEGGMLITSDEVLAERARSLRWHGISASTAERHAAALSDYDVEAPGFNFRFDDPRAAAVRARLARLDEDNARRAAIASAYREALRDEERIHPTSAPDEPGANSHCLFTAVVAEGVDRDRVRLALAERGVQTSLHFPPLHLTSAYRGDAPALPLSESYGRRALTLPLFPEMGSDQLDLVVESLREALSAAERRSAA
jgi:dTDP-4-amino-4,6-dideoxygalactose transaminase